MPEHHHHLILPLLLCISSTIAFAPEQPTPGGEGDCRWTQGDRSPCRSLLELRRSSEATAGKLREFVEQQYVVRSLGRRVELHGQELRRMAKQLTARKEAGGSDRQTGHQQPIAEPLLWTREEEGNEISDGSHATADLWAKLGEVSRQVAQVGAELESERRSRRHLEDKLDALLADVGSAPWERIAERLDLINGTMMDGAQKLDLEASGAERLERMEQELVKLRSRSEVLEERLRRAETQLDNKLEVQTEADVISCPTLSASTSPGLALSGGSDKAGPGQTIFFSCSSGLVLSGIAFTRCRTDGTWSHTRLPRCL